VTREFSREEYEIRIKRLIWSRVVLATVLVGVLILFQRHYIIYPFHTAYVFYFLFSVYGLTAVYWYLLKNIENLSLLAYLQTSGDIILVTVLTYLTGGVDSGFSLLYHLAIISSSIILYRRGGYLSASLSSILYGAMLDMQYYNVSGFVRSQNFTAVQVLFVVFINILSFYTVGLLSGYLAERLRKTRQELQEKSVDLEGLRVLQEHILRSVGSGILTMDLQGNIASWNPAAEHITGYRHDEIKSNWQQVFGDGLKAIISHTDSLKTRPFRFDGQIMKKDGSNAILGMTASLLKDEANAVRGIILVFQDITKVIEMEEHLRTQERLATVGSLAAGIAHEIRNPLASLSGSIQVLQGELDLQGDNKHLMDIVVRETDRLNTIITEFLEYARLKNTQNEPIELLPILDETIMLLKNCKDCSCDINISHTIDSDVVIQGDAQRLRQVCWNLLNNACQAMPQGGEVVITARPFMRESDGSSWWEIRITDTGQGIAIDDRDKIFNPFFTTKTGGTGLGLAIVYRIIEDHRGTITVDSVPGRGTQFIIRLPMVEEAARQGCGNNANQSQTKTRLS
jgi:two-component system sensor histidine kinase PilS (NtrC family)